MIIIIFIRKQETFLAWGVYFRKVDEVGNNRPRENHVITE